MTKTGEYIRALTGLRAIAAYMVFFHHFPFTADIVGTTIFMMLWQGHIGVSVFFVLSGFLIALRYGETATLSWSWFRRYLQNRFARIYPMYAICSVASLLITQDHRPIAWFLNLTLMRGFFGDWYFSHVGQTWSLTVELVFYLIAPVVLVNAGRVRMGMWCVLFYTVAIFCSVLGSHIDGWQFFRPLRMVVVNTFFGRCFEFLLGMWTYRCFRGLQRNQSISWLTYLGMGSFLFVWYGTIKCRELSCYSAECLPVHHYVLPITIALFILGLWKEQSYFAKLLGNPIMVVLGHASYIFYLIHSAPFSTMIFHFEREDLLAHFATMNLIAVLAYYLLEKPLNDLLKARPQQAVRPG